MKELILIGFVSLFVIGECGLLGAKECTFGPSYWCGSIRNAKECNAVQHCIQTVWEKQILPEDNDDICSICKKMVKEARDQLESNETQEEIRQVFEGSCKLIPIPLIRDECIKLSDEFIPELIDTLASQMNPQAVCATAGLCNSIFVDRLLLKYKKDFPEATPTVVARPVDPRPDNCEDCKRFISDLTETVKTHPRSEVLNHLLTICARLSSLSDGCIALVQANFEDIYHFLTRLNSNDVCDIFGMCPRIYGNNYVPLKKTGDEPCDFCVAVINNWRNSLVSQTTKDEFKMIMEGICHQAGTFSQECLSLVDQYFEQIYDILVSEIDPKQICEMIGLCGDSFRLGDDVPLWSLYEMAPKDRLPLIDLRPSFDNRKLIGQDEANSYKNQIHLPRVSLTHSSVNVVSTGEKGHLNKVEGKNECVMCEFVLHFLQNYLQDQDTREEIEDAVEKVCSMLPHTIAEECQDYIEAYGNQLIDLLSQSIDPSLICPMLKLCPGRKLTQIPKIGPSCVICEYVMSELDEILKDKSNEDAVRHTVEKVCFLLPKSVSSECKSFLDEYIDQIIDLIVNGVTPHQICRALGLCDGNSNPPPFEDPKFSQLPVSRFFIPNLFPLEPPKIDEKKENKKQSAVCVLCEFVINRLDEFLLQNATEEDIKGAIGKVCLLLPTTLMNDCLDFMEEYGNALVELLVNNLDPAFVCREIDLCEDTFQSSLPMAAVRSPMDDCLICQDVMNWVDKKGRAIPNEEVVEAVILDVCLKYTRINKQSCTNMIFKHGQLLGKLLEELGDAKRTCQAVKMCPYHGSKPLLGASRCTWGPSYWCQSKLHADSCKATQHCIEKVWENAVPPL